MEFSSPMASDNFFYGVVIAVLAVCGAYYWFSTTRKSGRVARVTRLIIYPIKSCKGIDVHTAKCAPHGLTVGKLCDRQFVIADAATGEFVTARKQPSLVLVEPKYDGQEESLILTAPYMPELHIKYERLYRHPDTDIRIWKSDTKGVDCGEEMSNWFSSYLQQEVKVLFFNPETCIRRVEDVSGKNYTRQIRVNESNAVTMFSDGYPFLICNESSVEELKKKLPEGACTISVNNFRPNIVVSDTSGPYIEDEWRCLNINGVKLYCEKPCGRCTLTTVDPKTGVKNAKAEPLNTLFKTRVLPEYSTKSPMFCWNMVLDSTPGDINVGDGVYQ